MVATQSRDHIPPVPSWFKFLLVAKLIVALAVLGLAAYGATFNDFFAGNGYAIFCVGFPPPHGPSHSLINSSQCIALLLTETYYLLTTTLFLSLFHPYVYLATSFLHAIWWLACWANLASWAGAYKLYYVGVDLSDFQDCADRAADASYEDDADRQFGALEGYDDAYLGCLKERRKRHRDISKGLGFFCEMCVGGELTRCVVGAAAGIGALEW